MDTLTGTWAYDLETSSFTWSPEMFLIFDRDPLAGVPTVMELGDYIHLTDVFIGSFILISLLTMVFPQRLFLRFIRQTKVLKESKKMHVGLMKDPDWFQLKVIA